MLGLFNCDHRCGLLLNPLFFFLFSSSSSSVQGGSNTTTTTMASTIHDNGDSTFTVTFDDSDSILTTLTTSGADVEAWLRRVLRIHRRRLHCLVVGLDTEWRAQRRAGEHNPVALLQLCVGRRCLLFHIAHADYVPPALARFLSDGRFSFVGAGVGQDARKLVADYGLWVMNTVELGELAAGEMGREELRQAGLITLARVVLGVDRMEKSKRVTLSRWDARWLTAKQVKYACVDAFVSFEVGRRLLAGEF